MEEITYVECMCVRTCTCNVFTLTIKQNYRGRLKRVIILFLTEIISEQQFDWWFETDPGCCQDGSVKSESAANPPKLQAEHLKNTGKCNQLHWVNCASK